MNKQLLSAVIILTFAEAISIFTENVFVAVSAILVESVYLAFILLRNKPIKPGSRVLYCPKGEVQIRRNRYVVEAVGDKGRLKLYGVSEWQNIKDFVTLN